MQNWFQETQYRQIGRDPLQDRPHSHLDCCELLRVDAGTGTLLMGDTVCRMEPGKVYCIPAGQLHCTTPSTTETYVRSKLVFYRQPAMALLQLCGSSTCFPTPFPLFPEGIAVSEKENRLLDACFCMNAEVEDKLTSLQQMTLLTQVLLWLWQRDGTGGDTMPHDSSIDPRIHSVLSYINRNLTTELSIDTIADYCHLSKFHMCRLFRENTGMTIMQYVLEQRLVKARYALTQTDLPVSTIAMQTGFPSISYFCHVFREKEGISPTEFRKWHRQN